MSTDGLNKKYVLPLNHKYYPLDVSVFWQCWIHQFFVLTPHSPVSANSQETNFLFQLPSSWDKEGCLNITIKNKAFNICTCTAFMSWPQKQSSWKIFWLAKDEWLLQNVKNLYQISTIDNCLFAWCNSWIQLDRNTEQQASQENFCLRNSLRSWKTFWWYFFFLLCFVGDYMFFWGNSQDPGWSFYGETSKYGEVTIQVADILTWQK